MVSNRNKASSLYSNFTAFISYSHVDAAIVKKLHRKIETYVFPKSLRNDYPQLMQMSESGRKIGPIFRDREDLPAGQDLSDAVKAALKESHSLIIICSPNAKKSPWVAREIEVFRELHPDRPILAAIIDGEPEECFPIPLIADGTEPLAADLRKGGDGRKLGFLKLVAGIANIPLDALIQRDAQRKLRSVMAITLVAGVGLLAMTMMTIFAFQQRNEAQLQRVAAEGLINFMLTDLRSELKSASTLRVRTKVNQRALEFYSDQGDLSALPDDSLGQRAVILHALGEDDENRGDLAAAYEKFIQAHRVTEELLEREPDNTDRIFEHAQSEYWVGRVSELREDYNKAQKRYERYANLSTQLYKLEGDSERALLERAYAANNLGVLQFNQFQNPLEARKHINNAIKWFTKVDHITNDNKTIKSQLANAYAWKSSTYFREKKYQLAKEARLKENEIKLALFEAETDNNDFRYRYIISERAIALIDVELSNNRETRSHLNRLLVDAKELVDQDKDNQAWRSLHDLIIEDLGKLEGN